MHTEKQNIFDKYAISQGYNNWDLLVYDYKDNLMSDDEFSAYMFEACDLVQKAQQDRIANNAVVEPNGMMTKVDKSSITSENNLIK